MSAIAEAKLLTLEDYLQLPDNGIPTELIRGKVVEMNLPYPYHGYVCSKIDRIVGWFAEKNQLGRTLINDSGIITHRNPDSLRGSDVAFISYARLPVGPFPQRTYLDVVPDLVFEVLSPSDRWKDVLAKVTEYLGAGVTVVCIVDPKSLTALVYRDNELPQTFDNGDVLSIPDVLPGFELPVRQFFE